MKFSVIDFRLFSQMIFFLSRIDSEKKVLNSFFVFLCFLYFLLYLYLYLELKMDKTAAKGANEYLWCSLCWFRCCCCVVETDCLAHHGILQTTAAHLDRRWNNQRLCESFCFFFPFFFCFLLSLNRRNDCWLFKRNRHEYGLRRVKTELK